MKIEKWKYDNVNADGTFKNDTGSVVVEPMIRISTGEGCGLPDCKCSPGCWVSIGFGRKNGRVEGITVHLTLAEMSKLLTDHEVRGTK
jgi:hypothetical protein